MSKRTCKFVKDNGDHCGAAPLLESESCFVHAPEYAEEMAENRRRGGLRHRREQALALAYDFQGLDSIEGIRRVFEIATIDGMALDNSAARSRILIAAGLAAAKLLEMSELEARVQTLEAALGPRLVANKKNAQGRRDGWKRR